MLIGPLKGDFNSAYKSHYEDGENRWYLRIHSDAGAALFS